MANAVRMIRCCCKLPHFCQRDKEPNVTHGLVDYPPQEANPEREDLYARSAALGMPYYNTPEAAEQTRIFGLLTYPFNTAKAI
jgi:hypothetical protein